MQIVWINKLKERLRSGFEKRGDIMKPVKLLFERYRPHLNPPIWLGVIEEGSSLRVLQNTTLDLLAKDHSEQKMVLIEQPTYENLAPYSLNWLIALFDQSECYHQELHLSIKGTRAIAQILPFQLEHLLPFPIEEAAWSFSTYSMNESTTRVFVSCTRQSALAKMVLRLQALGLKADVAISPVFALLGAHQRRVNPPSVCLYGWLRPKAISFFLVDSTGVRGAREAAFDQPFPTCELLTQETRRTLLYLQATANCERCLLGDLGEHLELIESFDTSSSQFMSLNERSKFILEGMLSLADKPEQRHLLFENLDAKSHRPFWFLKGWEKCLPAIAQLQIALAALALVTWFIGYSSLFKSELALEKACNRLSEQALAQGVEWSVRGQGQSALEWVVECQQQLDHRLNSYPLAPDLPSVRDTLAWISERLAKEQAVELVNFDYNSERHPDPKHPTTRYCVKVDLELKIHDLTVADQLQQEWTHAYGWIDRPQNLIWKAQKDHYKVSFYLKDRTSYAN